MRQRFDELERRSRLRELAPGVQTVAEVLDDWLEAKTPVVEARTLKGYRTHAANIRKSALARRRFEDVKAEHLREYLNARVAEGEVAGRGDYGPRRTANKERVTLLALWNWANAEEVTERNPVRAVKPFRVRPRPRNPYPAEKLAQLLAVLERERAAAVREDTRYDYQLLADVVETCYWTGWRFGEACGLRRADVDRERWTVPIRSAANKGPAEAWPLPPRVREIVGARMDREPAGGEYVFGIRGEGEERKGAGGDARSTIENFVKRWKHAKDDRGEKVHEAFVDFTLHRLRHSLTTDMERMGEKDAIIQATLRHQTATMRAHYTHVPEGDLRAAQERLATWRRRELRQGSSRKRSGRPQP